MNTYGYIYLTTNKINGKRYIGQHKSKDWDYKYFGSGKILKQALEKYGINNFTCFPLTWAWNKNELDQLEKEYITHYKPEYNISKGGNGGITNQKFIRSSLGKHWFTNGVINICSFISPENFYPGRIISPETKLRQSLSKKGKSPPNKGVSMTEEQKEILRKINLGSKRKYPRALSSRQRMSSSMKKLWEIKKQNVA